MNNFIKIIRIWWKTLTNTRYTYGFEPNPDPSDLLPYRYRVCSINSETEWLVDNYIRNNNYEWQVPYWSKYRPEILGSEEIERTFENDQS